MATLRETKRRIKTAKNISQVTRALEMVSAVKMRRAQETALAGRDYVSELEKIIRFLARNRQEDYGDFFKVRRAERITLVLIGPQKGLVGPLTTNLLRQVGKFVSQTKKGEIDTSQLSFQSHGSFKLELAPDCQLTLVTVEKKAKDIAKILRQPIVADFGSLGRQINLTKVRPIANYLVDLYKSAQTDLVLIAYSYFENTVSQKPIVRQFLPIISSSYENSINELENRQILFEPSMLEVLEALLISYAQNVLYQIILESTASEHSSRMVAMKNAHDNAKEIIGDLTLQYNQTRQNAITNEIADIVSGSMSQ